MCEFNFEKIKGADFFRSGAKLMAGGLAGSFRTVCVSVTRITWPAEMSSLYLMAAPPGWSLGDCVLSPETSLTSLGPDHSQLIVGCLTKGTVLNLYYSTQS